MRCRFLPMGLTPLFVIVAVNFSIAADAATPNPSPSPKSSATATKDANVTDVPLIPRAKLFGNPQRARLRISPDGKRLAYIAPRDGVLNVWVAPVEELANARPVTNDRTTGIRSFYWTYSNRHLMYIQDKDGDEDFHLYLVDLESDQVKDLTPLENVRTRVEAVSERFPNEILIGLNDRPPHQLHDIYRVDLTTGERELVQENPGFAGFVTDDDYQVRFAMTFTPEGGQLYLQRDEDSESGWKEYLRFGLVDAMTSGVAGFDKSGQKLFLMDSRDRDTSALKQLDLETGNVELLAASDLADVSIALVHPTEKHVQAVTYTYDRRKWEILDPAVQADLDYLKTVADGEVLVTSRTLDDAMWTVAYMMDDGPIQFYLYDRDNREAKYIFTSHPELEGLPLVKMHSAIIKSRDGLNLVSYLSLPRDSDADGDGRPDQPLPMILDVHGGPWSRDSWGYNPAHQLWANRGYAILSVNYRGSTGFGKQFINAANKQWAGRMHDDLIDAVRWAVAEGITTAGSVAIMGGSYGGYATLVGLTFTPDVFVCGVDIVGPSSLVTLLENPPPYWMPFMPVMKQRVGDWKSEEGREFLLSRSPLTKVDAIQRPLLIAQGANDPRVKKAEADQIVAAMDEKNIPVTYVLFPEEGHGFKRPENRFAFYAVTEAFLAQHLGGRYEAIGEAFEKAVFDVSSGKSGVPGLVEALEQ